MHFFYIILNMFKIIGIRIGIIEVKTTPEKNAIIDISEELLLLIMGNNVSIAVAPAIEIDSKLPIDLAIEGTNKIAIISRKILLKKAMLPSSTLILESSIAESEYQPSPAETARDSPKDIESIKEAITPPKSDPITVEKGKNHILFPYLLKLEKAEEFFPISIPTKNSRKQSPISIKKSEFLIKKGDSIKKPKITPKTIDKKIPIIFYPPFF